MNSNETANIQDLIKRLQPKSWGLEIDIEKWFEWPADIFLLTSVVLKVSGAYRYIGNPPIPGKNWPSENWLKENENDSVFTISKKWKDVLCDRDKENLLKKLFQPYKLCFEECYEEKIESLHRIKSIYGNEEQKNKAEKLWKFLCKIYELHSIADESFKGLGILHSERSKYASLYLHANFLLVIGGTLSRISKHHGIVIPKIRTPQVGITLRSISHYLTFHSTEVDVGWYTGPWLNIDEDTLNIMIVPWPYEVDAKSFQPIHQHNTKFNRGNERHFIYNHEKGSRSEFKDECEKIILRIKDAQRETFRIHILVFPEMALRIQELNRLKERFAVEFEPHEVPVIIAGVSNLMSVKEQESSAKGFNRIVLSGYYSHKWFDIVQNKHHRWKIDQGQAQDYGLGAVLTGDYSYWESINIVRRRISFFAPSAWLTICPLICEDLARLEPVSEVIRGVGPPLLTAILMDGPQIKQRWPARYATVFADDPGSSVLTVTSLGMVRRSNQVYSNEKKEPLKDSHSIALWKDENRGWKNLEINPAKEKSIVLTISGIWGEEYVADGRKDFEITAVLTRQGDFIPKEPSEDELKKLKDKLSNKEENDNSSNKEEKLLTRDESEKKRDQHIVDITELSLFTYFVDSLVGTEKFNKETKQQVEQKRELALLKDETAEQNEFKSIHQSIVYYKKNRTTISRNLNSPNYKTCIDYAYEVISKVGADSDELDFYGNLKLESEQLVKEFICIVEPNFQKEVQYENFKLDPGKRNKYVKDFHKYIMTHANKFKDNLNLDKVYGELGRIRLSVPVSILTTIHRHLTKKRRKGDFTEKESLLLRQIEDFLLIPRKSIYSKWKENVKIYADMKNSDSNPKLVTSLLKSFNRTS